MTVFSVVQFQDSYGKGESRWGNLGRTNAESVGESLTENLKTYKTYWNYYEVHTGKEQSTSSISWDCKGGCPSSAKCRVGLCICPQGTREHEGRCVDENDQRYQSGGMMG